MITGDPIIDTLLNFGLPGLAMVLIYLGMIRTRKTEMEPLLNVMKGLEVAMSHTTAALKGIERRLAAIETNEEVAERERAHTTAIFEGLAKQISDTQHHIADTQQKTLMVLEKVVMVLEDVKSGGIRTNDKLDGLLTDVRVLQQTAGCKVDQALVRATVQTKNPS